MDAALPAARRRHVDRAETRLRRGHRRRVLGAIRSKLWLIPGVTALGAFVAVRALVAVDHALQGDREAWFLFGGTTDGAREVVSTIASAMMTFTGLVFSITILVLQLASGQFSPRVLRTFLEDRNTHVTMATFVGTFVFAIALLPAIRSSTDDAGEFVPALSVFVVFLLVLASVGVFIQYIHHIAHSIRAVTIIKRVATETREAIENMYPEGAADHVGAPIAWRPTTAPRVITHRGTAGVLAAVEDEALLRLAHEADAVIEVVPMVGDFVVTGGVIVRCWPAEARELACAADALTIQAERTPHQDPMFGFRQLVDIAERALSPGINDPSTAVQALDEIHDLLRRLVTRGFPSPVRIDREGTPRLVLPRPGWDAYVHLALDEIRQYGAGSIQIARRLRALLDDCLAVAPPDRRPPLEEQRALLDRTVTREQPDPRERAIARQPSMQGHGER